MSIRLMPKEEAALQELLGRVEVPRKLKGLKKALDYKINKRKGGVNIDSLCSGNGIRRLHQRC